MAVECTKIGQECDRRGHKTSCIEHYVFGGKHDRNPKVTVTTLKARGDRQLEPDRQRRTRPRRTPAQVRPPRPVLLGSKPAGHKAALETVFLLGAPRGKAIPGTGAWRGRKPSRRGGGAGGRGERGPRERATGRPGGRERSLAAAFYRSRRGPGGRESPAALVPARRPALPGLAHAALANNEDLQGGQHVLLHPDPAPLRAQLAAPVRLSTLHESKLPAHAPCSAAAALLLHRVFKLLKVLTPLFRLEEALRLRKPRVPGVFPEAGPPLRMRRREEPRASSPTWQALSYPSLIKLSLRGVPGKGLNRGNITLFYSSSCS